MDTGGSKSGRRLPVGELTLTVAVVMAIVGLVSMETARGRWAMAGAIILGLLAGLELRSRERQHRAGPRERPPDEA